MSERFEPVVHGAAGVPAALEAAGVRRGDPVALAFARTSGIGLSFHGRSWAVQCQDPARLVAEIELALSPRWVWWSADETATPLIRAGIRPSCCWDLAAVHRLLFGGWADDPTLIWCRLHDLDPAAAPRTGQLDMLVELALGPAAVAAVDPGRALAPDLDADWPVGDDGYLRPGAADPAWRTSPRRAAAWAALADRCPGRQADRLEEHRLSGRDPVPHRSPRRPADHRALGVRGGPALRRVGGRRAAPGSGERRRRSSRP